MSVLCVVLGIWCSHPDMHEICARLVPTEDISTFELAYLFAHLTPGAFDSPSRKVVFTETQWNDLPPRIKAQFQVRSCEDK